MSKLALIIIDLQNDYFYGGKCWLPGIETAASNAAALLAGFRTHSLPVFHVRHESLQEDAALFLPNTEGSKINVAIAPLENEPVVVKNHVNCFQGTNLRDLLDSQGVDSVMVCGAMTNTCVEAATRAASDFGYKCFVAHDACATMNQGFMGIIMPAYIVHCSTLATLAASYATVASTAELLAEIDRSVGLANAA